MTEILASRLNSQKRAHAIRKVQSSNAINPEQSSQLSLLLFGPQCIVNSAHRASVPNSIGYYRYCINELLCLPSSGLAVMLHISTSSITSIVLVPGKPCSNYNRSRYPSRC